MLTITLVRHGQTDCSRVNSFCGSVDVPLTAAGREMAVAIGEAYADRHWQAIYASPLQRALDTAAPLAARVGLPVQQEEGLREIDYGAWDGMLVSEIERLYPDEYAAWAQNPATRRPPGGETAIEIERRAMAVVQSIRDRYPDGDVFVAAHKAVIRIIVCALLGINLALFRQRVDQAVGAATVFEFKSAGPLLVALNDLSHLPPHLRHVEGT